MEVEVSVVIPTYNRAGFLPDAIESILCQSFKDYEIIIVDDGSTDNTKQVLKPYLDKIKYICKKNGGVSSARNRGIREANGRWIAFLDSDDYWKPEKLEQQLNFIKKNNLKICFTGAGLNFGGEIKSRIINNDRPHIVFEEAFELVLWHPGCILVQTMLIEKKLIEEFNGFDENFSVAEDTKLVYQLALNNKFGFVNQPLTVLDRHESHDRLANNSELTRKKFTNNHIEIYKEVWEKYNGNNSKVKKRIKHSLGYFLSRRALANCGIKRDGYFADAIAALKVGGNIKTVFRTLGVLFLPFLIRRIYNPKKFV